jgi:hypothetical protein
MLICLHLNHCPFTLELQSSLNWACVKRLEFGKRTLHLRLESCRPDIYRHIPSYDHIYLVYDPISHALSYGVIYRVYRGIYFSRISVLRIILFPDQRCVLRLLSAMREPGDDWVPKLLFGLMPVPVQTMIGMMPSPPCGVDESVHSVIVRVWWEYNGRTAFFAHHLTAKLIRKSLKRSPEQPGPTAAPPLPYYADEDLEQTDLGLVDPQKTDQEQTDFWPGECHSAVPMNPEQMNQEQTDPHQTDLWPGDCQSTVPDPLPGHEPGC